MRILGFKIIATNLKSIQMKNKLSIIIILLFTSFFSFSQDYSTKSVAELEKLKTEAIKSEDYQKAGQLSDEIKRRANEVSNSDRIIQANTEMKEAVSKENYQKASELKKEITLREKLEVAIKAENYSEAASIKEQLNGNGATKEIAEVNTAIVNSSPSKSSNSEKATVYMIRVSALGFAVSFKYFDGEKFIGQSKGVSYIKVDVDPGEHIFWASAENQSFITVNAQAGKTYFIYVDVKMGAWSAQVNLTAVRPNEESRIKRGLEVINGHPASTVTEVQEKKILAKLNKRGFVKDKMNAYETKWKSTKNFQHIDANEFIPESKLK